MSRRASFGLLATALASLAAHAHAQDPRALARQVERLDSIAVAYRLEVAHYQDSLSTLARQLDTARVGPLVLLAERSVADLTAQAGRLAADSLAKAVGAATNRLSGHAFVVRDTHYRWGWELRPSRDIDSTADVSVLFPDGKERRAWRGRRTAEEIGRAMVHHALAVLFLDANRDFAMWLGNHIPNDSLATMSWLTMRLNLASATPIVSTRCFEGDIAACKSAFGLFPVADPVMEWFDAPRRRRAVNRQLFLAQRLDPVATDRCVDQNMDAACVSVLRMMPSERLPVATPGDARASLVRLALDRGGPGAVDRLLAGGSPLERIERAAGVPIDTVVADWQRRVREARAPSRDVSGGIVLASMMWIGLLLLASTRSSRWR